MPHNDLRPIPLDATVLGIAPEPTPWLWDGYLKPGDITLLTSQWKTGKTTLLTGLLRHLGTGEPFLGRLVRVVDLNALTASAEADIAVARDWHIGTITDDGEGPVRGDTNFRP